MSAPGRPKREYRSAQHEGSPMSAKSRRRPAPILSARGIANRFGRQVVHDGIDLDVLPGEIVGIAGGSGSGKSVLLKTLAGLHRPDAGEVLVEGSTIASLDPAAKASLLGVLFQQGALFSSLTVAQNIMLPIREHTRLPIRDQQSIAAMKLALAGMSAETGIKFPSELSGGMVKRAAFARALALDPRLLFLDEPTADLDPLTATGIDNLILDLNQGLGVTVVVVTHDLATLFSTCHRVAVLVDKRITIDTLDRLARSDHPWIHAFLHGPRARCAMNARRRGHGNR
jgi:phospholipid/cholesterol/gamma-HCH transport system ATP-binding protein